MNLKFNHFSFLLNLDLIINSFARDIRKRFKYIILSNQNAFKSRSFTVFIFINITQKQIKIFKIVFFKARSNKRIFKRDFFYYNKILNKASHQFKRIFKFLNKDYISIYLFNNIIILNNFTPELSLKLINDNNLFNIII